MTLNLLNPAYPKWILHGLVFIFFSLMMLTLEGCASSGATRVAASEADKAYIDMDYSITHAGGSIRDTIQNTNQTTKGIVIGGIVGAALGSVYSSIGVIPGLAGGAIIGGAIGAYYDAYATLQDRLENRGANIILLGDQVMIIIPSYLIFNENSAALRPQAYSTLDMVAEYVSKYPNISVKISGYTGATAPESINTVLSQQQADAVEKYLWKAGINTRVLYAAGYGSSYLITKNTPEWASDNNRIVITLEKLPPGCAV